MGWDKDAEAVGKALLLISRRRSGETLLFRGLPFFICREQGLVWLISRTPPAPRFPAHAPLGIWAGLKCGFAFF